MTEAGLFGEAQSWFRLVGRNRPEAQVLPSGIGRFHRDLEQHPTSYAASSLQTAWREVSAHFGVVLVNPQAFRAWRLLVTPARFANLEDEKLRRSLSIERSDLMTDPPSSHCERVARILRESGEYNGLVYPSVRDPGNGSCLALFLEIGETHVEIQPADENWGRFVATELKR